MEQLWFSRYKYFQQGKQKKYTQKSLARCFYRASLVKAVLKAIKCEIGMRYGYTWEWYMYLEHEWRKKLAHHQILFGLWIWLCIAKVIWKSLNITEVIKPRIKSYNENAKATCTRAAADTAINQFSLWFRNNSNFFS